MKATDSNGVSASVGIDVTIEPPPPPPPPPPPAPPPPPPPPPSPGFDIELRFLTGASSSQVAAFAAAKARWEAIVIGDLPDAPLDVPDGSCHGALTETVDDIVIFVEVLSIDGPGGVLGQAGPCYVRSGSKLPITGRLTLDADDLDQAESFGILEDLVIHEMGHVIGIGTLWKTHGVLTGAGTSDPYFTGTEANDAFLDVGGSSYAGNPVPVENTGGPGTQDGHWRESVFDTEAMTGWLTVGTNPLSSVTAASLADQGYAVDVSAADGFSLGLVARQGPRLAISIGDDLLREPVLRVDPSGKILQPER